MLVAVSGAVLPAFAVAQNPTPVSSRLRTPLPFDPAVTTGTLPNGMRFYIRENKRPENRAELRLVLNAGSVLEDDDQRGLAHVVEHMAFRGTKKFARNEISSYLESIGMRFGPDLNAFTGFDETGYLLTIPTDSAAIVDKGFQILAEWAHNITLDSDQIERERPVVVEEWRLGQGAENRMQNKWFPILFAGSRYGTRLPIGDRATLETFKPATLRRYYETWYRPDLMAVVAVGDFDRKKIEALIRTHLGAVPRRSSAAPRTTFVVPGHDTTLVSVTTDKEATRSVVRLMYKQPARANRTLGSHRQALVEGLFLSMLNDRFSEIVQKPNPPFINASAGQGDLVRSAESFTLDAIVPDGGLPRGLDALLTEVERVRRFGFLASELERAKKDRLRGLEQSFAERDKLMSSGFAGAYMQSFLRGDPVTSIDFALNAGRELYPGIGLAEINRLAGEWTSVKSRVVATTSPDKAGLATPTRAELIAIFEPARTRMITAYAEEKTADRLLDSDPRAGRVVSERAIPEVGIVEWKLSNGVRVLLKPTDFNADQIAFTAYSPGGTSLLTDSAYFRAMAADFVPFTSGVGKFSAVDLQKFLAGKQVSVTPDIGELREGISGGGSLRDVETMMQLVHLYFTEPRLDTAAFGTFLARYRGVLANQSASPESAFGDTLQVTLAQHAYRKRPINTAILDQIDAVKSFAFYKDRFADAGDFTFVFVGNLKPDSLKPLVEKWIGSLPSMGRRESWRDDGVRIPRGVIERVVKKGVEPKSRTAIVFSGPMEFDRRNRYQLTALSEFLNIKLRETLREERGGTYGVGVSVAATAHPFPSYRMTIGFGSAPDKLEELTSAVFAQIDSLQTIGTTDAYLVKVKEAALRSRETALRQNNYWLGQISSFDMNGWPLAEIPAGDKLISSLTTSALREAALRYLRKDNYVRVSLYPENFAVEAR